jgi:hypothetical protein
VHPTQVAQWKKEALDHLRDRFADGRKQTRSFRINSISKSGQLKVELDWLKKAGLARLRLSVVWVDPEHPQLSIARQMSVIGGRLC